MTKFSIKLKGIVRYQDKYLLLKKWYDDRIAEPYQWEFIDTDMTSNGTPSDIILEAIERVTNLKVDIDRILYTWTYVVGETNYLGIAYLCETPVDIIMLSEDYNEYAWVEKEEFERYIENKNLYRDVTEALKM